MRKGSNASELALTLDEPREETRSRSSSISARDHHLSFHDVRELRAYVLFLFKQIVSASKDTGVLMTIEEEEMRRLLIYLSSIMKDADQLIDFVPLIVAILTEQPSSVTDLFVGLGIPRFTSFLFFSFSVIPHLFFFFFFFSVDRRRQVGDFNDLKQRGGCSGVLSESGLWPFVVLVFFSPFLPIILFTFDFLASC